MTDARYTYTAGMPAARVGWLVARARAAAGIGDRDLASSVGVPVRTVRRWERGDIVPSDDEVEAIASACGARLTELLPRRATVSYEPATGIMQIADQAVAIPLTSLDNDTVLAAFVALVRRVRGLRLDQDVKVRQEDLDALGEVLDVDDEELEERLMRIIGMSRSQAAAVRAQLLRRRLAVPMVGMLASLSLLGINRFFTTGTEQVKAIESNIETRRPPAPTTTTAASRSSSTSRDVPVAPVVFAATAIPASSAAAPAPTSSSADTQAPTTVPPSAYVGPKLPPKTVQPGPPRTTAAPRRTTSTTQPPSNDGGGTDTTPPNTQPPDTQPPATQPPVTNPPTSPPTVPPIATTDGSTGTTEPSPPPTSEPTTTTTEPPPTTTEPPPTTTDPPVTTIGGGNTTETTQALPPPSYPGPTVGGDGTTGGEVGAT